MTLKRMRRQTPKLIVIKMKHYRNRLRRLTAVGRGRGRGRRAGVARCQNVQKEDALRRIRTGILIIWAPLRRASPTRECSPSSGLIRTIASSDATSPTAPSNRSSSSAKRNTDDDEE